MAYDVLPFPNADKCKTLIADAEERFRASEEAKREREETYRRGYKHFLTVLKRTKDWRFPTLISDPVLFSAIKTKSARMKKAIFSSNPVVRYKPEGDSLATDDAMARGMTQMFGHYQGQDHPRVKMGAFLEAVALAGTGFVMWHWLYEEAECTCEEEVESIEMVPVEDDLGNPMTHPETGDFLEEPVSIITKQKVKRRMPIVDRPTWSSIHFTEAFPDATALGIHDGDYFIRRTFRDEAYARRMAKLTPEQGGWSKRAVERAIKRGCSVSLEEVRKNLQWQADAGLGMQSSNGLQGRTFIEVWEVYRQQKLLCYTVLNRADVATYTRVSNRIGRIPVDMTKCHAIDNEFWGASDYQLLEKCLTNYLDQRNAGATETLLSVFGLTTVTPGFQMHKLLHEPGAVIPVNSHDDLRFQSRNPQGVQLAQNQMSQERASMDEVTASSESFRGVQPGEKRTATSDSLTASGAGLRLQDLIDDFEEQFIVPWGEWWLCLMQEHAEPDVVERILKDPEMVAAFFDSERSLDVVSGAQSSELRALEDKRMLESIEIQGKFRFPFIDDREMLKAYLERTIPEKVDVVVMDDEKILQKQLEQLQIQTQMEVAKVQAEAQVMAARAQFAPPPAPPGMPPGPPPPGMPGPSDGSMVDAGMSEPPMDAGMAETAGMMGQEMGGM